MIRPSPDPTAKPCGVVGGDALLVCMEELHSHLSSYIRRLRDVHGSALEQSRLNLGENIDFQQLLPKSS